MFQSNFSQLKRGVLDDNEWSLYQRLIYNVPATHGTVLTWADHTSVLSEEFVAEVEKCSVFSGI